MRWPTAEARRGIANRGPLGLRAAAVTVGLLVSAAAPAFAAGTPADSAGFRDIADRAWEVARTGIYDSTLVAERMTEAARRELLDRAGEATTSDDLGRLLDSFMKSFGLSHAGVFTRADVEYYVLSTVGAADLTEPRCFHIGALYLREPRGWRVRAVLEGYPAQRAGLKRGDLVLTAKGAPFEPVRSFDRGGPVVLGVRRGVQTRWVTVLPVRESVHESLHQAMNHSLRRLEVAGYDVGYVHLWACTSPAFLRDFAAAILDTFAHCNAIVLDLRDGFGGVWFEYADLFHADRSSYPAIGAVVRNPAQPQPWAYDVPPHRWFAGPLVAVVNDGTRSGKEGFAYQLQSRKRATLVGSTTAGAFNGMAATFLDPHREFLIETPVSRVTVDGHELEHVGVAPDVRVEDPIDSHGHGDPQLEAALDMVRHLVRAR